jgi:hypothetical protein
MPRVLVTLTLAFTLALATLCEADPLTCTDLLPRMATTMQVLRTGATPTSEQREEWRTWNAFCKDRIWQDQLAKTLPGGPLPPMVIDTPVYTAPDPIPSLTWRDYALVALKGFEQGISAPRTICRTTYAQRKGRAAYYTTCNTYGGY